MNKRHPKSCARLLEDRLDRHNYQAANEWQLGELQQLAGYNLTYKMFSRIILKRISTAADTILCQEQAGFRRGKSCIDHIFTLRQILQIMEQSTEWKSTIYITFIDFEKAFDSLQRESLWRILYTDVQCRVACTAT